MNQTKTKVSVLNLVPRFGNESVATSLERATNLAKIVEELGYERYWVGEHHNIKVLVCSATEIIIQNILAQTKTISVGSGGVLLPNHTNLQIAEAYGTLASLYPNRVELGVGRAAGTDVLTRDLIYRQSISDLRSYEASIKELEQYFADDEDQDQVKAFNAIDTEVPVFVLGGSVHSARIAAKFGLPYAFASHFSSENMKEVIDVYRNEFKPSDKLAKPYVILALTAFILEDDDRACQTASITMDKLKGIAQEKAKLYPHHNEEEPMDISSAEKLFTGEKGLKLVGGPSQATKQWLEIKDLIQPDEVMASTPFEAMDDLKESYRILKDIIENN